VDHSQSGVHSESRDSEWDSRVARAASADVRRLLRSASRQRRERWLVLAIVLVAVAAVLTLLFRVELFDGGAGFTPPPAPGGAPADPAAFALNLNRPFASSPAAAWPDGAAGIAPPPARRVGEFSAVQVDSALRQVRDVLVASRLDRRLLVDHDPAQFLGALAPDARGQLEPLFGSGREAEVQSLVSMVADGATLLPVEPKVNGRMIVRAGDDGKLVVHTNYVFVYAFHTDSPERVTDPMDILVVVRAEVDYVLHAGERWARSSQGWWYGDTAGFAYSIACDTYRKGFLAPAFTERTRTKVSGPDRDVYFDPDRPLPAATGCPG
jgi:hypothetical protein